MVFQSPSDSFDPRRTLGDGIAESLINNGMSKKGRTAGGGAASGNVRTAVRICRAISA